ncbi:MAG: RES domain-containing protein [bacterium]
MASLRPRRVEGVWHRFIAEPYKEDAGSDQGALEHGGRYNPRREFGALYLSDSPAACRAEMQRRPGVRARYWHARITVRVTKALDLTNPSTRECWISGRKSLCPTSGASHRTSAAPRDVLGSTR